MLKKEQNQLQGSLFFTLKDTLSQNHPLFILSNVINWKQFEDAFRSLYCEDNGRPAKKRKIVRSKKVISDFIIQNTFFNPLAELKS